MSADSNTQTKGNKDSVLRTFVVALLLCVVCSVVVSAAAVMLKPSQAQNKELDRKVNILNVAGIKHNGEASSVDAAFKKIDTKIVDLSSGKFVSDVDPKTYDAKKAAKDPAQSIKLTPAQDIASIRRQAKYQTVYLINNDKGGLETLIVPVHGYGLWSTLYGYLALKSDLNTVEGLTFYSHQETPGLGGEVDNPKWKASWQGKKIYQEVGEKPEIRLIKGKVGTSLPDSEYKIDGLSGATLTSNGVTNLMQFWLGEQGYAKFLKNFKNGEA